MGAGPAAVGMSDGPDVLHAPDLLGDVLLVGGPRVLVGGTLVLAAMYLVELGPRAPDEQDVAEEIGGVQHVGPV